uniref:HAT C-terminal dimerisation domain-containing protein n=1 Tax=Panagrolaimus sp. ES5 TaxID=591445 RepID=A0AC34GM27_9BILA
AYKKELLDPTDPAEVVALAQPQSINPIGFEIQGPIVQAELTADKSLVQEIKEFYDSVKEGKWAHSKSLSPWFVKQKAWPKLFEIAMAVLSIPASSSPVERMISQLTLHNGPHKNRSQPELLRAR